MFSPQTMEMMDRSLRIGTVKKSELGDDWTAEAHLPPRPLYPDVTVQLTGQDGNGFVIVSRVRSALYDWLRGPGGMTQVEANTVAIEFFTEALSGALGGFGRGSQTGDSEANGVFVQAIDPAHFAGRATFEQEMGRLAEQCRESVVAPGHDPVRIPGDRSLARKRDQLENGVGLIDTIVGDIRPWAVKLDCPFPDPI